MWQPRGNRKAMADWCFAFEAQDSTRNWCRRGRRRRTSTSTSARRRPAAARWNGADRCAARRRRPGRRCDRRSAPKRRPFRRVRRRRLFRRVSPSAPPPPPPPLHPPPPPPRRKRRRPTAPIRRRPTTAASAPSGTSTDACDATTNQWETRTSQSHRRWRRSRFYYAPLLLVSSPFLVVFSFLFSPVSVCVFYFLVVGFIGVGSTVLFFYWRFETRSFFFHRPYAAEATTFCDVPL